jgi:Ca2+/Na+ antiporter
MEFSFLVLVYFLLTSRDGVLHKLFLKYHAMFILLYALVVGVMCTATHSTKEKPENSCTQH